MARKRFGQHFLHERSVIQRIVSLIDAREDDRIVEIGPGHGALTEPLLERVRQLSIIEIDHDLIAYWRQKIDTYPSLHLIAGDALKVDYAALSDAGPLRMVGNLPYNISSPLLFKFLGGNGHFVDMHFMLQKEVVDRMVAKPGSRAYGRLSVAIAARAEASLLFDVAPGCFTPPPRVMSSVVRLQPRTPEFTILDQRLFDRVITTAFNQRRKTLRNALQTLLTAEQIQDCNIDPRSRPEQLAASDYARLANRVTKPC